MILQAGVKAVKWAERFGGAAIHVFNAKALRCKGAKMRFGLGLPTIIDGDLPGLFPGPHFGVGQSMQ